jgi:hypothetical protein
VQRPKIGLQQQQQGKLPKQREKKKYASVAKKKSPLKEGKRVLKCKRSDTKLRIIGNLTY